MSSELSEKMATMISNNRTDNHSNALSVSPLRNYAREQITTLTIAAESPSFIALS